MCFGAVGILSSLLRSFYERNHFILKGYRVVLPALKKDYRLVFLTDLHNHSFGTNNALLRRAIDQLAPDGILIGGDMPTVKRGFHMDQALRLCRELAKKYPVFYANGNHESRLHWERKSFGDLYEAWEGMLKKAGVYVLGDQRALVEEDLCILGLELEKKYFTRRSRWSLTSEEIRDRIGSPVKGRCNILLAHSPLFGEAYRAWGADLTLSGHFHGGTIRLGPHRGLMTPQFQFFYPCCAGGFQRGNMVHIVGAGLGTHSVNLRLNNPPEIVVLDLKKGR